jgi:hypothetical protein
MGDHRRLWRDRERRHFKRLEKKQKKGKMQSVKSARIEDFDNPQIALAVVRYLLKYAKE